MAVTAELTVGHTLPGGIESILAADIGSTWTHVCLIDRVEGTYRLIARAEEPSLRNGSLDVLAAVRGAVQRIERIAQRSLLDGVGELISPEGEAGVGVDAMVACSSAGAPLRCAVIGLTADLSLASATQACANTMARVTQAITLEQSRGPAALAPLLALEASPPEVIVLTGGFDNGPVAPLQAAAEMLAAVFAAWPAEQRPSVVYAGNQEARRPVAHALGSGFRLAVVDNVRPNEDTESPRELQRELNHIYRERQLAALPGMETLRRWCAGPIISTGDALAVALQFLARRNDLPTGVLGVDIGGNATSLIGARQGALHTAIDAGVGTAGGLRGVLGNESLWRVAQWLPTVRSEDDMAAELENASLYPTSVPQTLDDLLLVHAAARVAVAQVYERWRADCPLVRGKPFAYNLIAARGGCLTHCPHDGLAALMLLDALQPVGLARLVLDWGALWPQLGVLAATAPLAASQVFNRDGVSDLGMVLCPTGTMRAGDRALRIVIESPTRAPQSLEVPFGDIIRVPLSPEESVTIKVWPNARLDLGLGEPGRPAQARIQGGRLGLIIDARGRPLQLPSAPQQRAESQQRWINALCPR
ncbi:MAG: glutamate mutase L [Anaerolineales bacterium]